jgi:hypothetical protein
MTAGAEDLEQWMLDAIRHGLAALDKHHEEWDNIARRMVDAKAKGWSLQLKAIANYRKEGWPEKMMEVFGQLYLGTQGIQHFEQLPEALQEQLLQVAGVSIQQKTLLEEEGIHDDWLILSRWRGLNQDQAAMQKTWLLSLSDQQIALLIEYDYMGDGFQHQFNIGQIIHAELVFYPESYRVRALLKNWTTSNKTETRVIPFPDSSALLREYARALSANPWLERFPCLLDNVIPVFEKEKFILLDATEKVLPMQVQSIAGWTLVSLSSARPLSLFGEWDGTCFHPLAAFLGERFVDLGAMVSDTSGAKRFGGFGKQSSS